MNDELEGATPQEVSPPMEYRVTLAEIAADQCQRDPEDVHSIDAQIIEDTDELSVTVEWSRDE